MNTYEVIREMINSDGLETRLVMNTFSTYYEACHALKVYKDSHPTSMIGDATFTVKQINTSH